MAADDHLEGRDVDAEFAAIVAGWDDVPNLPPELTSEGDVEAAESMDAPEAVAESTDRQADTDVARPPQVVEVDPVVPEPVAREVPPPGIVEAGLEEGHFEPKPVELPPQEDLHFWGIVIGLTIGPLMLLWMAFFGAGHSHWWTYAALALSVGGFALLVLRQPKHRDDDPDHGARV